MQYLLLIYANEKQEDAMPPAETQAVMKAYGVFTQSIVASGHIRGGERLRPSAEAMTVRMRKGKRAATAGPFAETHEQLGGYYLIEAKDMEEAMSIAARIPSAEYGSVEVRPIWPMS